MSDGDTDNAEAHSPDQEILNFKIETVNEGERLDAYLASQIDEWSRARLQRLIESEDVLVNGKTAKPSYKLRVHDEIEVELSVPGTVRFAPEDMPINIVYEDDVLLVVNNPAGLAVPPSAGIPSGTTANGLSDHFQQIPPNAGAVRTVIFAALDQE